MWIWTQIGNATQGDVRGNLRPISVRTPLVLVCAFGFLVPAVFAQRPPVPTAPPPMEPLHLPTTVGEAMDLVHTRNTPHDL
jgi:hypothetical protein